MNSTVIKFNAVVFEEGGVWVAQCLEYNFVSSAATLEELPGELLGQALEQIEADLSAGCKPFEGFKRAPQKYWDMFQSAKAAARPLKPHKSLALRWREFVERFRVDATLFPVTA